MKTLLTSLIFLLAWIGTIETAGAQTVTPFLSLRWVWGGSNGNKGDDEARAVATDKATNAFVTGYFNGEVTFHGVKGEGGVNTKLTSRGGKDIFIAKYTPTGGLRWVVQAGGKDDDAGQGISTSLENGKVFVYVTGYVFGSGKKAVTFGDKNRQQPDLNGNRDVFVAKYDGEDGELVWVKVAGGTSNDEGTGIAAGKGNAPLIGVTGLFRDQMTFGVNLDPVKNLKSAGAQLRCTFVVTYDATGTPKNQTQPTVDDVNEGLAIAIDDKDGLFVTGDFYRNADFGNGTKLTSTKNGAAFTQDIYVVTYDKTLTNLLSVQAGGDGDDAGLGIAVNRDLSDGLPRVTGYYGSSFCRFSGEAGNIDLANAGSRDGFVASFNNKGKARWATAIKGSGFDQGMAIAVDVVRSNAVDYPRVWVAGVFSDKASFGPYYDEQQPLTQYPGKGGDVAANGDLFVACYRDYNQPRQNPKANDPKYSKGTLIGGWPHFLRGGGEDNGYGLAVAGALSGDGKGAKKQVDIVVAGSFTSKKLKSWSIVKQGNGAGQDQEVNVVDLDNAEQNGNPQTYDIVAARLKHVDALGTILTRNEIKTGTSGGAGDRYVDLGRPALGGLAQFTIEGWVKPNVLSGTQSLFGQHGAVELYLSGSTLRLVTAQGGSLSTSFPDTLERWHYLAAVGDSLSLKLYIDGVVAASGGYPVDSTYGDSPYDATVGSGVADSIGGAFDGAIDEVRFWAISLPLDELRSIRHLTLTGEEVGLIGYWRFDEGAGDTVADLSFMGSAGRLINAPAWLPGTAPIGAGESDTEIPSSGPIDFPGTNLDMNFGPAGPASTLVVSHIIEPPNISPRFGLASIMPEYWIVNRYDQSGSSPFSAMMTFTLGDNQAIGDIDAANPSNLLLYTRFDNSDSLWTPVTSAVAIDQIQAQVTFAGIDHFSQYTFGTFGDSRLPVELADFTATASGGRVYLSWRTASEVNNAGFELQRARAGDSLFAPISSFLTDPGLVGLGTSSFGKSYNYVDGVDDSLLPGTVYLYRLVDIGLDGTRTLHEPREVRLEQASETEAPWSFRLERIAPNPARAGFDIQFYLPEPGNVSLEIYAADGRMVALPVSDRVYSAGGHRERIATAELPAGAYLVKLRYERGERHQRLNVVR